MDKAGRGARFLKERSIFIKKKPIRINLFSVKNLMNRARKKKVQYFSHCRELRDSQTYADDSVDNIKKNIATLIILHHTPP